MPNKKKQQNKTNKKFNTPDISQVKQRAFRLVTQFSQNTIHSLTLLFDLYSNKNDMYRGTKLKTGSPCSCTVESGWGT